MKKLRSKPCRICGNPVTPTKRQDRNAYWYPRQCKDCWKQSRNPEARKANISKAMQGSKHPRFRPLGSRRQHRSREGSVYWLIKIAEPRTWAYEHRVVMAQALGRPLLRSEDVHHINHDTLDNRPENLELMSHGAHKALHAAIHARCGGHP